MVKPEIVLVVGRTFDPTKEMCKKAWLRILNDALSGQKPDIQPLVSFFHRLMLLVDLKTREQMWKALTSSGAVHLVVDAEANKLNYEEPWVEQAFTLPFEEAINSFASRIPALESLVRFLDPLYRNRAFWVAGVESLRTITQIKELLIKKMAGDISLPDMTKEIEALTRFGSYRIETIWRTNLQTAFGAGIWGMATDPETEGLFPYFEYDALTGDPATRKTHATMDGFIAQAKDPIWDRIWIPNGFSCRCSVRPVTRSEAFSRGLIRRDGAPAVERLFKSPEQRALVDNGSMMVKGHRREFPDPGFEGNPGRAIYRR